MFRQALAIARRFTWPVVISRATIGGSAGSGIGTFIVVNEDGWIVTAAHILEEIDKLVREEQQARAHEAAISGVNNDPALSSNEKRRRIKTLGRLNRNHTDHVSSWWGRDDV